MAVEESKSRIQRILLCLKDETKNLTMRFEETFAKMNEDIGLRLYTNTLFHH